MQTDDFNEIMSANDHAELTLMCRRIEFLRFKANAEIWQCPGWRQRLQDTYSDVAAGIGIQVTKA
jgi:hypothetical protein